MAISKAVENFPKYAVATFVDTAGGGGAQIVAIPGASQITVQRVSGAGTYTVLGGLDGVKFAALPTALAAINDDLVKIVTGNPLYISIAVAAAAGTIVVYATKL